VLTALDLGELPDEVPPTAVEIVKDRLPLRLEARVRANLISVVEGML